MQVICVLYLKHSFICRVEETATPAAVVPHNGVETENKESKRDSAKLNITCSSIVTKVQNGGVARHGKGTYNASLFHYV